MASDLRYFPSDGPYWPVEATIYAQYLGDVPNPCRKYHISSALEGAEIVASIVLPELVRRDIFHKVVKSRSLLSRQLAGDQAGKFITLYMSPHVTHRNPVIASLGEALLAAHRKGLVHPGPKAPRSRPYRHVFIEMPLDEGCFIYGGDVVDPTV